MRKLVWVILLSLPLLTACNTMQGIGEDLESGGRSLSRAADSAK